MPAPNVITGNTTPIRDETAEQREIRLGSVEGDRFARDQIGKGRTAAAEALAAYKPDPGTSPEWLAGFTTQAGSVINNPASYAA
jgi:hypothetical protein